MAAISLIVVGAIACTCVALDAEVGQRLRALFRDVAIGSLQRTGQPPREIMVAEGNEFSTDGSNNTIISLPPDEVAKRLAWAEIYQKNGWIWFRGQTLQTIVSELNRHNRRKLKVGDPETGRIRVGGKFRLTDVDGFVAALGVTHGVKATHSGAEGRKGEVITLTGGTSEPQETEDFGDEAVSPSPTLEK